MKKILVITGTPGVGKTTLTKLLCKKINAKMYDATSIVNKNKFYSGTDKFGSKIVQMEKLSLQINRIIKSEKAKTLIFEGHLLCDIKIKGATAIVLREHLQTIKKRLEKRDYPTEKLKSDIVSEAIDYCGSSAQKNYSKVFEVMSGKKALDEMEKIAKGKNLRGNKQIDLLHELIPIIKNKRELAI